jgi:hypothetical protein
MAMASLSLYLRGERERVPTAALDHALLQIVVRDKAAGLALDTLPWLVIASAPARRELRGVPQSYPPSKYWN